MNVSLSFEVIEHDVGRIGKLYTRHGVVNTPTLIPVVHPSQTPISPQELSSEFNCEIIITSAYLLKQHITRRKRSRLPGSLGKRTWQEIYWRNRV